jgi:hypothetical protein
MLSELHVALEAGCGQQFPLLGKLSTHAAHARKAPCIEVGYR